MWCKANEGTLLTSSKVSFRMSGASNGFSCCCTTCKTTRPICGLCCTLLCWFGWLPCRSLKSTTSRITRFIVLDMSNLTSCSDWLSTCEKRSTTRKVVKSQRGRTTLTLTIARLSSTNGNGSLPKGHGLRKPTTRTHPDRRGSSVTTAWSNSRFPFGYKWNQRGNGTRIMFSRSTITTPGCRRRCTNNGYIRSYTQPKNTPR